MSIETNKAIARRLYDEVISSGNFDIFDELVDINIVDYSLPPGSPQGREAAKENIRYIRGAMRGWHCTIEDLIAEGDEVVLRGTFRSTHTGEFFGIPPTGKAVEISGIHILRIVNGKVTEHWANNDDWRLMQQLGVISLPEQSG